MIDAANLQPALFTFIQRNAASLFGAGDKRKLARAKTLRAQDLSSEFFPMLDAEQYGKVQDWLADASRETLEKFIKENEEDAGMRLLGYIAVLLGPGANPDGGKIDGEQERARCCLGLLDPAHKQHSALALLTRVECNPIASDSDIELTAADFTQATVVHPRTALNVKVEGLNIKSGIAACAGAAVAGNRPLYARLLEHLRKAEIIQESTTAVHDEVKAFYRDRMESGARRAVTRTQPAEQDQFTQLDGIEVLAFCQKVVYRRKNSAYGFSRVAAVRAEGTDAWHELSKEQASALFPLNGSLMHFEGQKFPQMPAHGSYAVWKASEQHMTDSEVQKLENRVFAQRRAATAYRVHPLDHIASKQRGLARQWLRDPQGFALGDPGGERLLLFEDGVFVRSMHTAGEMAKTGFREKLSRWRDLPLLQLANGELLYVGELPPEEGDYSLSEPMAELQGLLGGVPDLTRGDREEIGAALGNIGAARAWEERLQDVKGGQLELDEDRAAELAKLLAASAHYGERHRAQVSAGMSGPEQLVKTLEERLAAFKLLEEEAARCDDSRADQLKKLDDLLDNLANSAAGKPIEPLVVADALQRIHESGRNGGAAGGPLDAERMNQLVGSGVLRLLRGLPPRLQQEEAIRALIKESAAMAEQGGG